jgi:hypothetical protein
MPPMYFPFKPARSPRTFCVQPLAFRKLRRYAPKALRIAWSARERAIATIIRQDDYKSTDDK